MATKPATKKTETAAPKTLKDAAAAGAVRPFRQRKNGPLRNLPYLASSTDQRTRAEAVAARHDNCETVSVLAEDLNLSVATARPMITHLLLARAIEAGEHADRYTPGEKKIVISIVVKDAACTCIHPTTGLAFAAGPVDRRNSRPRPVNPPDARRSQQELLHARHCFSR